MAGSRWIGGKASQPSQTGPRALCRARPTQIEHITDRADPGKTQPEAVSNFGSRSDRRMGTRLLACQQRPAPHSAQTDSGLRENALPTAPVSVIFQQQANPHGVLLPQIHQSRSLQNQRQSSGRRRVHGSARPQGWSQQPRKALHPGQPAWNWRWLPQHWQGLPVASRWISSRHGRSLADHTSSLK